MRCLCAQWQMLHYSGTRLRAMPCFSFDILLMRARNVFLSSCVCRWLMLIIVSFLEYLQLEIILCILFVDFFCLSKHCPDNKLYLYMTKRDQMADQDQCSLVMPMFWIIQRKQSRHLTGRWRLIDKFKSLSHQMAYLNKECFECSNILRLIVVEKMRRYRRTDRHMSKTVDPLSLSERMYM